MLALIAVVLSRVGRAAKPRRPAALVAVGAYVVLASSFGMATRAVWTLGRPPIASIFELRLRGDAGHPYAIDWIAYPTLGAKAPGRGEEAGRGTLVVAAPPGACPALGFRGNTGQGFEELVADGAPLRLLKRRVLPRHETRQRFAARARLSACEALLIGSIPHDTRFTEVSLEALAVDGTVLARVAVPRPALPHVSWWPAIPVAAFVDAATLPLQLIVLAVLAEHLPSG